MLELLGFAATLVLVLGLVVVTLVALSILVLAWLAGFAVFVARNRVWRSRRDTKRDGSALNSPIHTRI